MDKKMKGAWLLADCFSAREATHNRQRKRQKQQSLVVGELPDDVVAVISAAEYGVDAK